MAKVSRSVMPGIDRRALFKLIGAGGAGAGAGFLVGRVTQPPAVGPVPESSGAAIGNWTNTTCSLCAAGCGIAVRTHGGRANKIEGNPAHPVNRGRLCALGQAGLQNLYNPDRVAGPLVRSGERFSGPFEAVTWERQLESLGVSLRSIRQARNRNRVVFLTESLRGHLGNLIELFMDELRSTRILQVDFADPQTLYAANKQLFDVDVLPHYDIANARFVLSFGADFLGTWLSPVQYGRGFGESRQGPTGARGYFVQIEPRMSISGAAADEWIPARPGTEGVLALGLAHQIVASGRFSGPDRRLWSEVLEPYSPDAVAEQTDVPAPTVTRLAEAFAAASPGLAIGGAAGTHTNGADALVAVNALNYLVGNLNQDGGVIFNPKPIIGQGQRPRQASFAKLLEFIEDARMGRIDALIISGANPAFTLPAAAGFTEALAGIPLIVSLSSFMDETTAMADMVLPSHTYLETWGDGIPEPGVGRRAGSISRPVVKPMHDTRATGDIILDLSRELHLKVPMPWNDMPELLEDGWRRIYSRSEVSDELGNFEAFWNFVIENGAWDEAGFRKRRSYAPSRAKIRRIGVAPPRFAGEPADYPFMLHAYLSGAFRDGRGANLPWLQAQPDPLTGVAYGSWVEINPATAEKLGFADGDVVRVESPHGWITAPALRFPGIRPDVIAMPVGQGHRQYGRYAKGRGANPIEILAPLVDASTGSLATGATRVRLSATGAKAQLLRPRNPALALATDILRTAPAPDPRPDETSP